LSIYVLGASASLPSQQVYHGVFLHELGFGAVEIHERDWAAGFGEEVQCFIEIEGVLKLEKIPLLSASADEEQMPVALGGKFAPRRQLNVAVRIDIHVIRGERGVGIRWAGNPEYYEAQWAELVPTHTGFEHQTEGADAAQFFHEGRLIAQVEHDFLAHIRIKDGFQGQKAVSHAHEIFERLVLETGSTVPPAGLFSGYLQANWCGYVSMTSTSAARF